MKIRKHPYTLLPGKQQARAARSPRHGVLLEVTWDEGMTGYADLHPWTEFGHAPLEQHLLSLKEKAPTPLAARALHHAKTDALARAAGVSLFDELPPLRSHALFTDWVEAPRSLLEQCVLEGYTSVKLKIGRHPEREAKALNAWEDLPWRWRLDANGAFTFEGEALKKFLQQLSPLLRSRIEFLEDPCAYDPVAWPAFLQREKIPLALDWHLPPATRSWPGVQVVVLKPASQDVFPLAAAAVNDGLNIVVTHSMDHPLGQAVALWSARRLRQKYGTAVSDGGLQAVGIYEPCEFSTLLRTDGPQTFPPPGTGFGFDELLARLPWSLLE